MGADVYHERTSRSFSSLVSMYGNDFLQTYSTSKVQQRGLQVMKNFVV